MRERSLCSGTHLRKLCHIFHSLRPAFNPVACCRHAYDRVDLEMNTQISMLYTSLHHTVLM